ncbi:iron complex transport system permease protein [Promicromonospora sukumoe]|uniref:Iron complex transport system permease protein n=1 Tax=Promicromonospora sukumoe TaxID=88382 RepID=A0A7W3JAN0_9MICO|nr:iron complex transport system permease protein [Promicromonospora sukumoe]
MSAVRPRPRVPAPAGAARLSPRAPSRPTTVALLLASATAVLAVVALMLGDYPLTVPQVLTALTGTGGFESTIVLEWRLPRVTAAILFGAALAISGALFQTLTRNPLGSPDLIGFATGSYTGVIVVTVLLGTSVVTTTAGALLGGLATAVVVYLLAYRRGVQGFRLIVVGIGVTAMLHALNTWLLLRAQEEVAMGAAIWGTGSLSLTSWADVVPAVAVLLVTAPLVLWASRPLRQLELGDDAAAATACASSPPGSRSSASASCSPPWSPPPPAPSRSSPSPHPRSPGASGPAPASRSCPPRSPAPSCCSAPTCSRSTSRPSPYPSAS